MAELDARVIELAKEMSGPWPDGVTWSDYRERIVALHQDIDRENDRLVLMDLHKALTDLAERHSQNDPERLELLRQANETQYRCFLLVEAERPEGGLDLIKYAKIADREVALGRLDPESDTYKIAKAGAEVLSPSPVKAVRSAAKLLFWKR